MTGWTGWTGWAGTDEKDGWDGDRTNGTGIGRNGRGGRPCAREMSAAGRAKLMSKKAKLGIDRIMIL